MAKAVIVIDVPTLSVDDLIQLVVAHDSTYDEEPIEPQHVSARDVLDLIDAEQFPDVRYNIKSQFED